MKVLLALIAVVAILFAVGWISFSRRGDQTTITIESGKMKHAATEAVEEGKQAFKDARDSVKKDD